MLERNADSVKDFITCAVSRGERFILFICTATSLSQDAHTHPTAAGSEVPLYVSMVTTHLHAPYPMQDLLARAGPRMTALHPWAPRHAALEVFCHGGAEDSETEMLSWHCAQRNGITSRAWGDTTVYQSFPGYLPLAFPSQGLWGRGRQRERVGWAGRRRQPRASAPDGALSYSLSLTASQLKHLKNVIMLHYPLPRAF